MAEPNGDNPKPQTLRDQAEAKNAAFLQDLLNSPEAEGTEVLSGPAPQPAPAQQAPEQASTADAAPAKMEQDDIDAMIAAKAAGKQQPAAEAAPQAPAEDPPAAEAPAPADAAPAKMEQDDIDAIIAKRAAAKQSGEISTGPAESAKPQALNQDSIDAMLEQKGPKPDLGLAPDEPEEPEPVEEEQALDEPTPTLLQRVGLPGLIVLANSLLIVLLLVVVLNRPSPRSSVAAPQVIVQQPESPVTANLRPGSDPGQQDADTRQFEKHLPIATGSGTNWDSAEHNFHQKAYRQALPQYATLLKAAGETARLASLRDFFRLRIGQCFIRTGQKAEARIMLEKASLSDSPIVRSAAHYELGRIHASGGQYLLARAQAYAGLAALGAREGESTLAGDCQFLIGRVMTEKALTFYNEADALRWTWDNPTDPFVRMSREQFRKALADGEGLLAGGLLGVEMQPTGRGRNVSVRCRQAPIHQLFQRMAAMTDVQVVWDSKVSQASRKRAITLFERSIDPARLAELACGTTGLISRYDGDRLVIYDPRTLDEVNRQKEIYVGQASKMWHRLDATLPYDSRIAKAHLGLGRMREAMGDPLNLQKALNDYHQIVNRFGHDAETAPLALLRSVQIYLQVQNFSAARKDLQTLIDQYPTFRADEAWLTLGNVTLESGMVDSARRIYRELFEDNLSPASRAGASYGVGRCYYMQDEHAAAIRWLQRYLGYTDVETPHTNEALLMLGHSFDVEGQYDQSALYLYRALANAKTEEHQVRALFELARVQLHRDKPIRTLSALRNLGEFKLEPDQQCEKALLESRAYRALSLPGRGVEVILNAESFPTMQQDPYRGQLGLERARGLAENDDPTALDAFLEVWPLLEPGEETWQAGCEMASLCLQDGKIAQAVGVLEQVLQASQNEQTRETARKLLTRAYILQQDYARAAEIAKTPEEAEETDQTP
jgi:tetratricopeptide (TPR) repeat protein